MSQVQERQENEDMALGRDGAITRDSLEKETGFKMVVTHPGTEGNEGWTVLPPSQHSPLLPPRTKATYCGTQKPEHWTPRLQFCPQYLEEPPEPALSSVGCTVQQCQILVLT